MKPTTIAALIAIIAIPVIAVVVLKGFDKDDAPSGSSTPTPSVSQSPMDSSNPSAPADAVSAKKVTLKTSKGDINLTLFPEDAPLAVQNFVTLGNRGYYDGVIFHRVIRGFMNQAGDPTGTGTGGESIYGRYFKTEINSRPFVKGVLGAARTSQMDTNGSQFFIMAADTSSLNNQYTAFGQVSDSQSQAVVDAINVVATGAQDKPVEAITITGFEIVEK